MKTPVVVTAVHLDAAKTSDRSMGNIKVSVEIDGEWLLLLNENFDPDGFHISHIVEGAGITSRLAKKVSVMAKAYITEYVGPGVAHGGVIPVANAGSWRENANSPMGITVATTASAAFGVNTQLVRVNVDATCSINIGVTVTATVNNARMSQGQTEYFTVVPGTVIAVIANT